MLNKSFIAALVGLVGSAHGFWRMECPGRVGLARIDPIVNPGSPSLHVHALHGSSGIAETADFSSLRGANCTSCRVTQDKSAYWHPAMYFKHADTGEFEIVDQVGGMLAYYFLNGENITAYPSDFRMLAGTTERRTFTAGDPSVADPDQSSWASLGETTQDDLEQRSIGFNCLNYERQPEGTLYRHYMPDKAYMDANCKDGVRIEIMFPSCWDGKTSEAENHKDHVAYPSLVINGDCPKEHPVRLPGLLYETIWDTNSFNGKDGIFVLANGDPTGFGYHADFIMGWDRDFLQSAVETCTSESGRIEDCPLFEVVDEATAKECKMEMPAALVNDNVKGPVSMLPGNVGITYGDDSNDGDEETQPTHSLSYAPGASASNIASPLPGQVFKETSAYVAPAPSTTSTSATTSSSQPPPPPAVQPTSTSASAQPAPATTSASDTVKVVDPNVSYESTQYFTNGNVVTEVLIEEEVVWVTEIIDGNGNAITTQTGGPPASSAAPSPAPPARKRRAAHMHGHAFNHLGRRH